MRKNWIISCFFLLFVAVAAGALTTEAQGLFGVVTGKPFDSALPKDFYLEGNAIPTQKRNAALVETPAGTRLVVALLDTSGYSSQIQEKYLGMLISEGSVTACGKSLGVGSFGFGLKKSSEQSDADAGFFLYDQAGKEVIHCAASKDMHLEHPSPLQVVLKGGKTALLYLGRYQVVFEP